MWQRCLAALQHLDHKYLLGFGQWRCQWDQRGGGNLLLHGGRECASLLEEGEKVWEEPGSTGLSHSSRPGIGKSRSQARYRGDRLKTVRDVMEMMCRVLMDSGVLFAGGGTGCTCQ